jgi:Co/Zn/Cd efflux system component
MPDEEPVATTVANRRTTFSVTKMDCPSEERLIRMKLEARGDVRALVFDLANRSLDVVHSGDVEPIARELEALHLGSSVTGSVVAEDQRLVTTGHDDRRLLWQVLLINLSLFAVELAFGYFARSMGLVADSFDMLADAVVYGLSLYAIGRTARHKGGVAAISGLLQMVLAILGLLETVRRFITPQETPDVSAMIGISFLALAGNAACLYLLQKSRSTEAHMRASMIFTSNDVIANIGVILAGALVYITASKLPDLAVGVVIFLLVARGAVRILRLARA